MFDAGVTYCVITVQKAANTFKHRQISDKDGQHIVENLLTFDQPMTSGTHSICMECVVFE